MARRGLQTMPLPKEHQTTIAVADALRLACAPGWLWSHFPAGELRDDATGAKLKRMGLKKGWSDFVLIAPGGQHHWLELKRGKAGMSAEQRHFALACQERQVPWFLARSFDEAIRKLTDWGALNGLRVSA